MSADPVGTSCFAEQDFSWLILGAHDAPVGTGAPPSGSLSNEDLVVSSFAGTFPKNHVSLSHHSTTVSEGQTLFHEAEDFSRFWGVQHEEAPNQDIQKTLSTSDDRPFRALTSASAKLVSLLESGICAGLGSNRADSLFLEKVPFHHLNPGQSYDNRFPLSKTATFVPPSTFASSTTQDPSHLPDLSASDATALSFALRVAPESNLSTDQYLEAAIRWHLASQDSLLEHSSSSQQVDSSTMQTLVINNSSSTTSSEREGLANMAYETPQEVSRVLNILGSTSRSKTDPFIDAAALEDPGVPRMARGGVCELFPDKLYRMIRDMDQEGKSHIIGFLPHGRALKVHKMDEFLKDVLPRYFSDQSKWSSFSRQLNLYGFLRATSGRDAGSYYHELFLQGRPNLVAYMRRVGAPKGFQDRRRFKVPDGDDPDFWAMEPVVSYDDDNNNNME